MESSSVDYDDYVDQSSCLQLYGVPEAMENWDLSPCMGQDGADLVGEEYHDSFLPRPMEVMSSSNEEEDSLNQVDIVGERNHSQDMNINSEQDGAEQHFRNTTGGQPYHGDVGVTQRMDTTTDANANVSMNANSRIPIVSATTTTQHTHGAPPPSASSMYQAQPSNTTVPLPSLPSGSSLPLPSLQSLHHHHQLSGLLRADNAAAVPARTTNNPANLTSFSNNLPIGTNNNISNSNTQMAMAFPPPPSSPDSLLSLSSSSSSSYSSIPSYYLKSGNSTLETSTASTCSKPTVMLSQGDNANRSSQEDNKSSTSTDTSTSTGSTCSFGAEGGGDESSRRTNELVPSSPPTSRHAFTADPQVAQPLPPNRLARIRQSHLANKRRGQMKNKTKLPEVSENSELETTSDQPSSEESSSTTTDQSPQDTSQMPTPHISITSEDNEDVVDEDCKVTPSIPDIFLNKLKVSSSSGLEQMSEKEIESKFVSLSLAFQTDKLTIDQRVSAQERARDLSEQNVDKELQGLGEAVEVLNQTITDCEVREIVQKIRRHINVLEQSAARVSSRAEVYGAVQQERRMCKAIEVMVQYTENLRRAREKEGTELQEARKILNERSLGAGLPGDYDTNPNRRSMSVGGFNVMGRPMRRRSEVVLPKVLGGVGSPSLTQTASMENVATVAPVIPTVTEREDASGVDSGGEDPRSRFQSAVASTTMKNAITNTIKRASLERLQSMTTTTITGTTTISASSSPRSSTVSQPSSLLLSSTSCPASVEGMNGRTPIRPDRISESSTESKDTKAGSGDEDAYRKGYEEGLKARLSQDLIELRDQQTTISSSLEDVMDRVDQAHEQDLALIERPSYFRTALLAIQRFIVFLMEYDYWSNKKVIRNFAGVLFVLMAIFAVFLSPPSSTIDLQHFSKPPQ